MKNIEIKARVDDLEKVEEIAKKISDTPLNILKQHDIFYNLNTPSTKNGRLKLRQFEDGSGELIYYERPDIKGPKFCKYSKVILTPENTENMKEILSKSNGILGTVKKVRNLYVVQSTRIHIDRVEGLGNFMELEVVINNEKTPEYGEEVAKNLMKQLGIPESALLSGAYLDMILSKQKVCDF